MTRSHPIAHLPHAATRHKRIVVVGNSGSLLETPPQCEWPDDLLVIGVNRLLRPGRDGRQYTPDVLVVSDNRAFRSDADLIRAAPSRVHVACPSWGKCPYREHWVFEARRTRYRWKLPVKLTQPFESFNNVSLHALQLASILADEHADVFLLGIEGRWPRDDKRRKRHHFYRHEDVARKLQPFRFTEKSIPFWGLLGRHIRRAKPGVKLWDCSAWPDVSALPYPKRKFGFDTNPD